MDRWVGAVFHWLHRPLARQAAGEVARECRGAIIGRAVTAVQQMSIPQARGYIRALAPGFVAERSTPSSSRRRISPSLRRHLRRGDRASDCAGRGRHRPTPLGHGRGRAGKGGLSGHCVPRPIKPRPLVASPPAGCTVRRGVSDPAEGQP